VIRLQVRCRGTVQGVGFRPTVHRVATSLGLAGWVINDPLGAILEIEGPEDTVNLFVDRLVAEHALARLQVLEEKARLEPLTAEDKAEMQELLRAKAQSGRASAPK